LGGSASRRRGQSLVEYALLVGIVIGSLSIMQTYVRRSLAGRMRDASLWGLPTGSQPPQYAPYYARAQGGMQSRLGARYTVTPDGVTGKVSFVARAMCDDPETGATATCTQETTAPP